MSSRLLDVDEYVNDPNQTEFYCPLAGGMRTFSVPLIKSTLEPQYLSDYINNLEGDKRPPLKVYQIKEFPLRNPKGDIIEDNLAKTIAWLDQEFLAAQNLYIEHALIALSVFIHVIKEKLPKEWKSVGIIIGSSGSEISPISLVNPTYLNHEVNACGISGGSVNKIRQNIRAASMSLAFAAAAPLKIYRSKKKSDDEDIVKRLQSSLNSLFQIGVSKYSITSIKYISCGWSRDDRYIKICALIDMYFNYFKTANETLIRTTTISCRYKDCEGLVAFNEWNEMAGGNDRALSYSFFNEVNDEIIKLRKKDVDEIKDEHSYLPYISSLFIPGKSPYSTKHCKAIYTISHLIGCFMGKYRSGFANILDIRLFHNFKDCAICLAYKFTTTSKLESTQEVLDELRKKAASNDEIVNFKAGGQETVINYIFGVWTKNGIPKEILVEGAWAAYGLPHDRPGTFGYFLNFWAKCILKEAKII